MVVASLFSESKDKLVIVIVAFIVSLRGNLVWTEENVTCSHIGHDKTQNTQMPQEKNKKQKQKKNMTQLV